MRLLPAGCDQLGLGGHPGSQDFGAEFLDGPARRRTLSQVCELDPLKLAPGKVVLYDDVELLPVPVADKARPGPAMSENKRSGDHQIEGSLAAVMDHERGVVTPGNIGVSRTIGCNDEIACPCRLGYDLAIQDYGGSRAVVSDVPQASPYLAKTGASTERNAAPGLPLTTTCSAAPSPATKMMLPPRATGPRVPQAVRRRAALIERPASETTQARSISARRMAMVAAANASADGSAAGRAEPAKSRSSNT